MKYIVQFFSSVKLAIFLLIIITLASMLGTLIPQQRSPAEYASHYGQISNFLIRLQITDLYHSGWFVGLLILLSLNIIVCTLTRLSPKLRKTFQPRIEIEARNLLVLKIKERFRKNKNLPSTKQELREALGSARYRIKEKEDDNKTFLHARKKILGWFGADMVHLGLLIILAGGIISGLSGFRDNLNISEGQTIQVPKASFKLRLDKFETEYYPNGSVRDWKSTLSVIENENAVLTKDIEVNHPLSHKGFVFYQSSYGWNWENTILEIWVKKKTDSSFLSKTEMRIGQRIKLQEENIEISAQHFVPDFIINEKNEIITRSLEPNNPAAFIEGWQEGEKIFSGWIFAKFPDFSRIHSEKENDLNFELKNYRGNQYSGIQMAKDPGVNLIWLGCTLLMIGLFIAFYWSAREIKIILEESQEKTDVIAGGIASKNKEDFQQEFEKIVSSLRRSK